MKRLFKNKNMKRGGFTLIELLVVISIIALLSSIVLASLNSAREKASRAVFMQSLKSFHTALEIYRDKEGKYPFQGEDIGGSGAGSYDNNGNYTSNDQGQIANLIQEMVDKKVWPPNTEIYRGGAGEVGLSFEVDPSALSSIWLCGGKPVTSFVFAVNTEDNYLDGKLPLVSLNGSEITNFYCIAE